jgi:hypothetical protein
MLAPPWHGRWSTLRRLDLHQDAAWLCHRLLPSRNGPVFPSGDHHDTGRSTLSGRELALNPLICQRMQLVLLIANWHWLGLAVKIPNVSADWRGIWFALVVGLCQRVRRASEGLKAWSGERHDGRSPPVICCTCTCLCYIRSHKLIITLHALRHNVLYSTSTGMSRNMWRMFCLRRAKEEMQAEFRLAFCVITVDA